MYGCVDMCVYDIILLTSSSAVCKMVFKFAFNLSDFSSKHQNFIVSPGLKADKLG